MSLSFSSPEIARRVEEWTSGAFDARTRTEVQALVDAGDVKELEERFYKTLAFGTGGLRGLVGAGTNRMNSSVVSWATQGLANYLQLNATRARPLRAAITHDCRHFSREFAETAAGVLAANGIIVHISTELRPTPWLSFLCRHLECHTGIVVTASHNPSTYNGFKVYWDDGSQVVPPHDKGIIAEVSRITGNDQVKRMDFQEGVAKGLIHLAGDDIDRAYLDAVRKQRLDEKMIEKTPVRIVYTPLHGAGGTMVPPALADWGFNDVFLEPEQMIPDGDFPTAASPNPEEGKALELAIALAKDVHADLVLATDPDGDRLGIAVLHHGDYRLLTGNELGALLCEYLLGRRSELGILPAKPAVATTIVTTPLFAEVAVHHGARCALVLTGFKWIAKAARDWAAEDPEIAFLYGSEESYGFLIGDHAMDKDGTVASCCVAEMTAWCKTRGMSLVDLLEQLYLRHQPRIEWQKSITMPGKDGAAKIAAVMERIKSNPPRSLYGQKVLRRTRIDIGEIVDGQTDEVLEKVDLPRENVILFDLEGGARVIARPSGTEPKIKFYFFMAEQRQDDIGAVRSCLRSLENERESFQVAVLEEFGIA